MVKRQVLKRLNDAMPSLRTGELGMKLPRLT
jgi:hypothetical protein